MLLTINKRLSVYRSFSRSKGEIPIIIDEFEDLFELLFHRATDTLDN